MLKFDVLNRFSGEVQFTAEIECDDKASNSIKLGLAVKWAIDKRANLADAYLTDANLADANLADANLTDANLIVAQTSILPEGELIGWKKLLDGSVAKLIIPARAKRSNATGRKCRASYARVDKIFDKNGKKINTGFSQHESSFKYTVGKIVRPDDFDENRWNECASGIHFFITRIEAENYNN